MEGAGWEPGKGAEEGYITDSKAKELFTPIPIINLFSVHMNVMDWNHMYHCPIFTTTTRGATFVATINLRMDEEEETETRWILAGACLLLQISE